MRLQIREPYLVLLGDVADPLCAKTGSGIVKWCRDKVAGQLRFHGCNVDLGVPDLGVDEAGQAGVGSLVIGVAPAGGALPGSWLATLESAALAGLDIVSGLHVRLADYPSIAAAAERSGARLVDVRVPPPGLPVGSGRKRSGYRVLTVGTDCTSGKKYSALALHAALTAAGVRSTFRATGQTGIMIAGQGTPMDAVVADFLSGAAEELSPDNDPDHWDVIEGQGALWHPGYAAVSLGLLHGSQPDALVVCHDATRTHLSEWEGYAPPSVRECIEMNLSMGRLTNPEIRCVGLSINTSGLDRDARQPYLQTLSAETGLPCVDPIEQGMRSIVERMRQEFSLERTSHATA